MPKKRKVIKAKKRVTTTNRLTNFQLRVVILSGLVILLVGGITYCRIRMNDPHRVFNAMLENTLKTRGVFKKSDQTDNFQSQKQTTYLQLGQQNIARGLTELTQGENTSVITESIGTPKEDFVRYKEIKTDQLSKSGAKLDFTKALNIWGQTGSSQPGETNGQLFGEMTLGIIPIGYLKPSDREKLLNYIKSNNVYEVDYSKVIRTIVNGRPTYKYDVTMKPEAYVNILKKFASIIGLRQLDNINSATFKDSQAAKMTITIDVWSRQLSEIEISDTGRKETYGSYGAKLNVEQPSDSISVDALQQKLQSVN